MKRIKILYWIFTILFAGFMIWSSVPSIEPSKQSIEFLHTWLGFPIYFIQFISIAKIVGAIVILIPGLKSIKEWAYAGLFFDLAGAIFSVVAVMGKVDAAVLFISIPIVLGILSYIFWKKTIRPSRSY